MDIVLFAHLVHDAALDTHAEGVAFRLRLQEPQFLGLLEVAYKLVFVRIVVVFQ